MSISRPLHRQGTNSAFSKNSVLATERRPVTLYQQCCHLRNQIESFYQQITLNLSPQNSTAFTLKPMRGSFQAKLQ
jgi:hypothetical protein